MRYHHSGAAHSVSRITGPHHNYLSVTFATENPTPDPQVVELSPKGPCEHPSLDRFRILAAVLAGVSEGNQEHGAEFIVSIVEFVANDTGPEEVYRFMAKSLVGEIMRVQAQMPSRVSG